MELNTEHGMRDLEDIHDEAEEHDGADDSGTGAALALLVALLSFLLAVAFVILRHAVFNL